MAFEFLTQPTDTTVTEGGTWGCSAAVSGGIQGATGIINLPITSQLEACPTVGVIGSTIYVGTGYDQGNDGFVYSLSASTETPTQYINAGSAVAGCYGMDVIDGVLWSSFVDTSSPYVSIIYNGSTILTSVSGVSDIYGFVKFSNGNIMSWGKGGYSTTSYPWIGMYSGGSFTTKYSGAVVTNTSVASVVITGSTTAFGITATGAIIKTTDSGNTWSAIAQIGSSTVGNATISLYDGKLIASHTVNGWYQSVDGGTTWSTYANSPSIKGYRRTRLVDGILYVPSYNSNLVAYSEGGDVWRYLTISEGARVYDIAIYNGKAYCGIGATTGQGKIATVLIPSYLLNLYKSPSTLINSTTNTTGLYSYSESAELTDSGDYYITATNAGTTITSDTFTVLVEPLIVGFVIRQGDVICNCSPLYGYTNKLSLAMERGIDSRGYVSWLDNGRAYDQYETEVTIHTEEPDIFESIVASDSTDQTYCNSPWARGFHPFGFEFASGLDYEFNATEITTGGNVDIFGNLRSYRMTISPVNAVATFTNSGTIDSCSDRDDWQIGGIPFPFADWEQSINDFRRVIKLGSGSSQIVDTARTYGDIAKIKLTVSEDQARKILQYFTGNMRGNTRSATFPASYNIFGLRHDGLTSCNVKLYDNTIEVTHSNLDSVEITLTLQMVGV